MKNPKRILIIKLGAIGDVVHSMIIPAAIKQKYPDCEIHYLTSDKISEMLEKNPLIDKLYRWNGEKKGLIQILHTAFLFLFNRYDVIFNLTHSTKTFLLSYLAFPKVVMNKKDRDFSWVENYYYIAKDILPDLTLPPRLSLTVCNKEAQKISDILKGYIRPYVIFSPAGSADKNRQGRVWNIKKWQELADKIKSTYGGTVFVCGSEQEIEVHSKLTNVEILTGQFELKETVALLGEADLVVSGDTGLAHIASALDKYVVMLTGSTSPDKIKPYGDKGFCIDTPNECRHCWQKKCKYELVDEVYTPCMEAITSDMVMDLVKKEGFLK